MSPGGLSALRRSDAGSAAGPGAGPVWAPTGGIDRLLDGGLPHASAVLESFLEEALNISVSLGSTKNLWQRVSVAVAQPCQELDEQLKQESVLNCDETGWRSDGERRYCDRLFLSLQYPGVEQTNNGAERALRIAVQWRKTGLGNRSALGEIATVRLLTVSQTCPMQGRSTLTYLGSAVSCHLRGVSAPSLLTTFR